MKGQTVGDSSNLNSVSSSSRRVLEINPEHGIIHALSAAFKTKKYYDEDALNAVNDLYATSMIICGFTTEIPTLKLYKEFLDYFNEESSKSLLNRWTMTQQQDVDDASPFKHCIVVVETYEDENPPTADEIIFCYLHSLIKAIDRWDTMKMKIFWVSTKGSCAYAYGGLVSEDERQFREEVYIDGKAVSYDNKKLYNE
ncbi:heat shock protein 90-6, mitochondrial-like [Rutidosis leptorrhynchoides]|uniref:heat shock protein 90-6, mitochondrial-like n=1 Tax=Rutidosis leptorrhynchoides TaxID=125765 RepID=UPI003A99EA6A